MPAGKKVLVMRHILNTCFDQEVELSRNKVALLNFRNEFDRVGKRFKGVAGSPLQGHLNEYKESSVQFGGRQARVVATTRACLPPNWTLDSLYSFK